MNIVIVESPETGIHPQAIEAAAQAIGVDSTTQILTTTYSPIWVGAVSVERLRCFVKDAGAIRIVPGLQQQVDDSHGQIDVPLYFAAGLL